jgi:hypothetical protein
MKFDMSLWTHILYEYFYLIFQQVSLDFTHSDSHIAIPLCIVISLSSHVRRLNWYEDNGSQLDASDERIRQFISAVIFRDLMKTRTVELVSWETVFHVRNFCGPIFLPKSTTVWSLPQPNQITDISVQRITDSDQQCRTLPWSPDCWPLKQQWIDTAAQGNCNRLGGTCWPRSVFYFKLFQTGAGVSQPV